MKIKQILSEVSKAEKDKQRKAALAARRQTSQQQASAKLSADEIRAKLRQQKIAQQLRPMEIPKKQEPSGFLADPELAKYAEPEEESGVYLNFTIRKDPASKESSVWAYWSKSGVQNIDVVEPYGQVELLGKSPISQKLFDLIKRLIREYNYVHVYVDSKNLRSMPHEFKMMTEYLRSIYPEETGNVGIEVNPRDDYPASTSAATTSVGSSTSKLSSATLNKFEPDLVKIFRTNPTLSQAFRNIPMSQQAQIRKDLLQTIAIYSPDVEDSIPEIKKRLNVTR